MNAIPLPLRLVISVVLAAALGIGSFLVVGAIVNPLGNPAAETARHEVVPVYAPTSLGEIDEQPFDVTQGTGGSTQVGSIDVVTAGPDGIDSVSDLDAVLDEIAAEGSADDGEELASGDELGVHVVGDEPLADPCAPVEGSGAADCPPGTRSTVLALMTLPEMTVSGYAYPSTTRAPGQPACAYQNPTSSEVPFGVHTNTPADITVTYWPVTDPTATGVLSFRTSAAETDYWNSQIDGGASFIGAWKELNHCGKITGLTRGTEYAYDVIARDDTDRSVTQPTGLFTAGESGTEPPPTVFPYLTDSFIATVPHRADEVVEIRSWWVDPDVRVNNCNTGPDLGGELRPWRTPQTWVVSEHALTVNGYDTDFTRTTMASFKAPEGSYIFVCMRWFPADGASWATDRPLRQATTFLESPDQIVPTFTLHYMEHVPRIGTNDVRYTLGTIDDGWCPTWVGPNAAELHGDGYALAPHRTVLCNGADLIGHNWTADNAVLIEGHEAENGDIQTIALDLGVDRCLGICALPPSVRYRVFTKINDELFTGFMMIDVTWSQGRQNGHSAWAVRDLTYGEGAAGPEFAQLDTTAELRVIDEGGHPGIQFDLRTDRPAAFTARLTGDCFGSGTVPIVTGNSTGDGTSQTVTFSDLCRGSGYAVEVQLTDGSGTTVFSPFIPAAVWSPTRTSVHWRGGWIEVPRVTRDLQVSIVVESNPVSRVMHAEGQLWIGDRNVDLGIPDSGCVRASVASGPVLLEDADLAENVRVLLTFRFDGEGRLVGGVPTCDDDGPRGELMIVSTTVPLANLLAGTVRLEGGPDSTYPYQISLAPR